MRNPAYAAFSALDPFFDIVRQGLAGLVDGDHYFDTIAPDAVFEFRYRFPGFPTKLVGREALLALYAGYREGMALHGADALVVNISQTPGVVILEYEVQGNAVGSGKLYENRRRRSRSAETFSANCLPRPPSQHSPWQRGGIENANGRIRRDLPRKTKLTDYNDTDIDDIVWMLNSTPRKCLAFNTPIEAFASQLGVALEP